MEFAIWLIVGLVAGGAIGAIATWWISRARGGAVSVMQLKQENDKFRNEVAEHFVETARLINEMTDSYKKVFDHLSSGAEKLVNDEKLAERLPPASGEEVRLGGFGSVSASTGSADSGPSQAEGKRNADDERRSSASAGASSGVEKAASHKASGNPGESDSSEKQGRSEKAGNSEKSATAEKHGASGNKTAGSDPLKRGAESSASAPEGSSEKQGDASGAGQSRADVDSGQQEARKSG